jgi:UDP-N-acetylglucosamine--N-acetylmuramyl-(pentapeptide) pyrophosphoryl-undecaprenol N-acetylglucosamine transferase
MKGTAMTIVVTGGGSGGHITPILAVASQLKQLQPNVRIVYVGQKGDKLADIPAADANIDAVYTVRAGKFRRYHGEGWKQLLDIATQAKNLRDAIYVLIGLWQSFWLLRKLKPEIIFTRGGFVSVPVALGGKLNGIPFVTHDSDSVPSLANRIIARWATLHAVALPAELYPYPAAKTVVVGIPLSHEYTPVDDVKQQAYRRELGLDSHGLLVLVTGGGNGATGLNQAVISSSAPLLKQYPDLHIVHIAGRGLEPAVEAAYDAAVDASDRDRVGVKGFITDFYRYSGAADVIIARAGATNLAEFAVQGKACIIIPAGQLVGGHQTKNAEALAKQDAIVMLSEAQAEQERRLLSTVRNLLDDDKRRAQLSSNLRAFAQPDSAHMLAELLLTEVKHLRGDRVRPT